MSVAHEKLAKILRTQTGVVLDLEQRLEKETGKKEVMEKIVEENEILVHRTLEELGCSPANQKAEKVYQSLIMRLKHLDDHLYNFLDKPDLSKMSNVCGKLCDVALNLSKGMANESPSINSGQSKTTGFFIKKDKAAELLENFPPQNLLDHFGYKSTKELIDKEGFSSVFSALRFAQDADWMHNFFDKAYGSLTAEDFEEREVELKVLETQWLNVAEKFLDKKYHNVSHLKELGIIFVIPLTIDTEGETLRLFTLILHYLNEVPFYSRLFRKFSFEEGFSAKLKSLLRGDVPEGQVPENSFRIVQRYLAKDNKEDFRLFEPHINPEVEHWYKAEGDLAKLGSLPGAEGHTFGYWQGLDFVGDFFPRPADLSAKASASVAGDELVSFDLIDLVMSLVKKGEIKYLYHQQEALWNKIFIEYLGREKVEELVAENIISGFIKL